MHTQRSATTERPSRRARFLVQVLVGVLVLMWVPTIAEAAFKGSAGAPLTVGSYAVPAPAGVTGTYNCTNNRTSMTVSLTDISAVDRATGYTVSVTAPNGQVTTTNVSATTRSTSITRSSTTTGSFVLRIRANVGTWSGQNLERSLLCP